MIIHGIAIAIKIHGHGMLLVTASITDAGRNMIRLVQMTTQRLYDQSAYHDTQMGNHGLANKP